MSKISLSPNASGTGTLTIAAPNTSSDITLNLPTTMGTNNGSSIVTTDAAGNLGLGVAPSAHSSIVKAFDFNTTGGIGSYSNSTSTQFTYVSSNAFLNSSVNWTYKFTGYAAAAYMQNNGTGVHQWLTAPSGTAGNAITFTQAMTLDASGNLALGSTAATGRLSVNTGAGVICFRDFTSVIGSGTGSALDFLNEARTTVVDGGIRATNLTLAASGATPLIFNTNGSERARIDSSGNLLVGTTSGTSYKLNLKTSSASQSAIGTAGTSGDTAFQAILITKFDNNSTTSQNFIQFQINNGGANCGKITANGANTAAFGSTSDQRVKENIVELPSQLDNIMALRPVEYDYLESYGGGHQIGFIAQEMQQIYPDVIAEDDTDEKILSITGWSKTEARLVKAIQELHAIVAAQGAEIATLKGQA